MLGFLSCCSGMKKILFQRLRSSYVDNIKGTLGLGSPSGSQSNKKLEKPAQNEGRLEGCPRVGREGIELDSQR